MTLPMRANFLALSAFFWLGLTGGGANAQTVTLSPTTLPAASVGSQFYQLLTASGGIAPYVWTPYTVYAAATLPAVSSPPAGLTLTPGGILSGTPTTAGTYSFTLLGCDSSTTVVCGTTTYSLNVGAASAPSGTISWSPVGTEVTYSGLPIGAAVLDATTTNSGTVSYTYQLQTPVGPTVAATAATVLASGSYLLTAKNSADSTTATIHFTVLPQHEWIVNAAGNLTLLDAAGNPTVENVAGGGLGAAVDQSGTVWSGNTNGTSLSTFSSAGVRTQSGITGGGLSSPRSIAVDGTGSVWVANADATVSQFSNAGAALSPTVGFTGGGLSSPTGIAVDQAGNVWVSNGGNNSITEIIGAGAPVAPVTAAITNTTEGEKP